MRNENQDIGVVKGTHDIHLESPGYPLKSRGANTAQVRHGTLLSLDVSGDAVFRDEEHDPPDWILYHRFYTGAFSIDGANFSSGGDSGAAVLTDGAPNSDSEVVGILFGGSPTLSVATPIQQILSAFPALNLTIETATTGGVDKPVPLLAASSLAAHARTDVVNGDTVAMETLSPRLAQAQQEITATPTGLRDGELVRRHLAEVQALVNTNRRVATAWHRNGGSQILQGFLRPFNIPVIAFPP